MPGYKLSIPGLLWIAALVLLSTSGPLLTASFFHNLGSVRLVHGFGPVGSTPDLFESSIKWFNLSNGIAGNVLGSSYVLELAYLATLNPRTSACRFDSEHLDRTERGRLFRQATI